MYQGKITKIAATSVNATSQLEYDVALWVQHYIALQSTDGILEDTQITPSRE